ncbi:CBS domain-containing protein [Candidatus Gottesmanbacteria bacterium]|nr:CBS domain-containing protein [Candidatus Gottesmanbacteria bacterium]
MLYFAELRGKAVVTDEGARLGKLTDLVFLSGDQPLVTKVVVAGGATMLIPITNLVSINSVVKIQSAFQSTNLAPNELFVGKNLLDQQIIDIKGNKVVRVNDVVIQDKPYLVVAGVDVGILGVARWFKLEQFINLPIGLFGKTMTSDFLPWEDIQPVALSRGRVILKAEDKKLTRIPPEDLADHLERLSLKNLTKILDILPEHYEAEVIQNLNISFQQTLFRRFRTTHAMAVLSRIDPDEAADILLALPDKKREEILKLMPPDKAEPIHNLLNLSTTPIGDLITTNGYITVSPTQTARSVMTQIRAKSSEIPYLYYVYAVNKANELVGVCNLYELFIQNADTPMYKFMTQNVVVLHLTTPLELAIKRMIKYKVFALPVVDNHRRILGVVIVDDLTKQLSAKLG